MFFFLDRKKGGMKRIFKFGVYDEFILNLGEIILLCVFDYLMYEMMVLVIFRLIIIKFIFYN